MFNNVQATQMADCEAVAAFSARKPSCDEFENSVSAASAKRSRSSPDLLPFFDGKTVFLSNSALQHLFQQVCESPEAREDPNLLANWAVRGSPVNEDSIRQQITFSEAEPLFGHVTKRITTIIYSSGRCFTSLYAHETTRCNRPGKISDDACIQIAKRMPKNAALEFLPSTVLDRGGKSVTVKQSVVCVDVRLFPELIAALLVPVAQSMPCEGVHQIPVSELRASDKQCE
jgi:hypothetical protein